MIADIIADQIRKNDLSFAPAHQHILKMTLELCERYKAQQETLASISTMYVKTFHELEELKAGRS